MRWHEIINESGEAGYLYHWMRQDKMEDVFENDLMPARWQHEIDGRMVMGNSFTRNEKFGFGEEHYIRLTVDKRILGATNRIIPVDAELVHRRTYKIGTDGSIRDRIAHGPKGAAFAEEFVVGDIRNISRCIVKVDVRHYQSSMFYGAVEMVKQYCHTHDIDYALSDGAKKAIAQAQERWDEDDE